MELTTEKQPLKANDKLFDSSKPATQLIKIKCGNCGNVDKPKKWDTKFFINFLLIPFLNWAVIIYYLNSNPYICGKCNERHKLIKVLNDGSEKTIKSMSRVKFLATVTVVLIIGFILLSILGVSSF